MPSELEHEQLRVLVADERQKYLEPISAAVRALGHDVIAHETSIASVARATVDRRPDIAIVALHQNTGHALELITELVDESTCPVVVLADDADRGFVAEAAERGVFAYIDSTRETELQGGIDVAIQRFQQYKRLLAAFDRRARIERAKGILMERHGIGDQAAFDRLRSDARSSRKKLIEVVEETIAAQRG